MKKPVIIILLLSLACGYSCKNRNRMKIDEKALAEKILEEEAGDHEEYPVPDADGNGPGTNSSGIRLLEDRSIDIERPPVLIDVASSRENIKSMKLSDVASSIRYIRLETPSDSNMLAEVEHYQVTRNAIITDGINGIALFSRNGDFIETVSRNNMNYSESMKNSFSYSIKEFEGKSMFSDLSVFGEQIFYLYYTGPENLSRAVSYSLPDQPVLTISVPEENKIPYGKGETRQVFSGNILENYESILGLGNNLWAGMHNKWTSANSGSLLVVYDENGDTLCEFTDYQRIGLYQGGNYRPVAENSVRYYYNGMLTIKPQYQDTIFRVIPPNRLLPEYVIDFGSHKASAMEGLNPRFDLKDKWLSYSLVEVRGFLFFIYTQNNVGPANLREKSVRFYHTVFDKQEGYLYQITAESFEKTGLENDLDGGYPFWPDLNTPDDELVMRITGKQFRDYIDSEAFKNRSVSKEQRDRQLSIASNLADQDQLLILVKL